MPALHSYVHLLIFCTKRTSKSQRFKRGGSTIVLNVKRFHISGAFEWGFDFNPLGLSTLTFYKTSFSIEKMGFMYCIVCFVPAKYVDYHPRYVTQRLFILFLCIKWTSSVGSPTEIDDTFYTRNRDVQSISVGRITHTFDQISIRWKPLQWSPGKWHKTGFFLVLNRFS